MKLKCSWCGFTWENALKLPVTLPKGTISHGLCPICAKQLDKEMDKQLSQANAISNAIRGEKKL